MTTDTPIEDPAESTRLPPIEILLATLWLVLPAVQYTGTFLRTRAILAREVPDSGLERLDLTPWYIVLLGLTLAYAALKVMARRTAAGTEGNRW